MECDRQVKVCVIKSCYCGMQIVLRMTMAQLASTTPKCQKSISMKILFLCFPPAKDKSINSCRFGLVAVAFHPLQFIAVLFAKTGRKKSSKHSGARRNCPLSWSEGFRTSLSFSIHPFGKSWQKSNFRLPLSHTAAALFRKYFLCGGRGKGKSMPLSPRTHEKGK